MGRIPKPGFASSQSPSRSIELLSEQIDRIDVLLTKRFDDPDVDACLTMILAQLDFAFGRPLGENTWRMYEFQKAYRVPLFFDSHDREADRQQRFLDMLPVCKALLVGYIDELKKNPAGANRQAP